MRPGEAATWAAAEAVSGVKPCCETGGWGRQAHVAHAQHVAVVPQAHHGGVGHKLAEVGRAGPGSEAAPAASARPGALWDL